MSFDKYQLAKLFEAREKSLCASQRRDYKDNYGESLAKAGKLFDYYGDDISNHINWNAKDIGLGLIEMDHIYENILNEEKYVEGIKNEVPDFKKPNKSDLPNPSSYEVESNLEKRLNRTRNTGIGLKDKFNDHTWGKSSVEEKQAMMWVESSERALSKAESGYSIEFQSDAYDDLSSPSPNFMPSNLEPKYIQRGRSLKEELEESDRLFRQELEMERLRRDDYLSLDVELDEKQRKQEFEATVQAALSLGYITSSEATYAYETGYPNLAMQRMDEDMRIYHERFVEHEQTTKDKPLGETMKDIMENPFVRYQFRQFAKDEMGRELVGALEQNGHSGAALALDTAMSLDPTTLAAKFGVEAAKEVVSNNIAGKTGDERALAIFNHSPESAQKKILELAERSGSTIAEYVTSFETSILKGINKMIDWAGKPFDNDGPKNER